MAGVFTLTSNGRLMKPQFLNEEGKLQDWTSSNTTIGSSSKRKYDHLPNHFEKYEELYSSHDWTKFSEYKRVFTYYCASIDLENTKAEAVKKGANTGAAIFCVDTGDTYIYDAVSDTWNLQN